MSYNLVNTIENTVNNQPRKCLDFKTPFEVFYDTGIIDFVALENWIHQDNSVRIERDTIQSYNSYKNVLFKVLKTQKPTYNQALYNSFIETGEKYFSDLKILCGFVLANQLNKSLRNDHLAEIDIKHIVAYYRTGAVIAKQLDIKPQKMKIKHYQSIRKVYNIYLRTDKKRWCFKLLNFFGLYS